MVNSWCTVRETLSSGNTCSLKSVILRQEPWNPADTLFPVSHNFYLTAPFPDPISKATYLTVARRFPLMNLSSSDFVLSVGAFRRRQAWNWWALSLSPSFRWFPYCLTLLAPNQSSLCRNFLLNQKFYHCVSPTPLLICHILAQKYEQAS